MYWEISLKILLVEYISLVELVSNVAPQDACTKLDPGDEALQYSRGSYTKTSSNIFFAKTES